MKLQELYLSQNWAAKDPNRESAQIGNLYSPLTQEIIQRHIWRLSNNDFIWLVNSTGICLFLMLPPNFTFNRTNNCHYNPTITLDKLYITLYNFRWGVLNISFFTNYHNQHTHQVLHSVNFFQCFVLASNLWFLESHAGTSWYSSNLEV